MLTAQPPSTASWLGLQEDLREEMMVPGDAPPVPWRLMNTNPEPVQKAAGATQTPDDLQEKLLLLRELGELHAQQILHHRQQDQLMQEQMHFLDQQLHQQMRPPSLGDGSPEGDQELDCPAMLALSALQTCTTQQVAPQRTQPQRPWQQVQRQMPAAADLDQSSRQRHLEFDRRLELLQPQQAAVPHRQLNRSLCSAGLLEHAAAAAAAQQPQRQPQRCQPQHIQSRHVPPRVHSDSSDTFLNSDHSSKGQLHMLPAAFSNSDHSSTSDPLRMSSFLADHLDMGGTRVDWAEDVVRNQEPRRMRLRPSRHKRRLYQSLLESCYGKLARDPYYPYADDIEDLNRVHRIEATMKAVLMGKLAHAAKQAQGR